MLSAGRVWRYTWSHAVTADVMADLSLECSAMPVRRLLPQRLFTSAVCSPPLPLATRPAARAFAPHVLNPTCKTCTAAMYIGGMHSSSKRPRQIRVQRGRYVAE